MTEPSLRALQCRHCTASILRCTCGADDREHWIDRWYGSRWCLYSAERRTHDPAPKEPTP